MGRPSSALTEIGLANFSTGIDRELTKDEEMKLPADPESRKAKTKTEELDNEISIDTKTDYVLEMERELLSFFCFGSDMRKENVQNLHNINKVHCPPSGTFLS